MNFEEYTNKFEKLVWRQGQWKTSPTCKFHREGLLQFTADTHWALSGSFNGYGYFAVLQHLQYTHPKNRADHLITEAERLRRFRFSHLYFPTKHGFRDPATDEQHLQKRLAKLDIRDLKEWADKQEQLKAEQEHPTVEKPFALFIAGNDDTSYTKYYPTLEALEEELALYEACQPLNFYDDLKGFVFTN